MAFFENLGSKISEIGSSVASKTKEVTGITKLNASIRSEESKINNMYLEIGKSFYEENQGQAPKELYTEWFLNINKSRQAIKEHREEIERLKEEAKAQKEACEEESRQSDHIPEDNSREYQKGEAFGSNMVICPTCGTEVSSENRFCPKCGTNLSLRENKEADTIICKYCGKEVPKGTSFCPDCGQKIL